MGEIKIKTSNLSTEIGNLRALNQKISSSCIKCPAVVGGGTSIQEIENIGKTYRKMHNQFGTLVSSTISFMENVNNSYKSSDNKASGGFR